MSIVTNNLLLKDRYNSSSYTALLQSNNQQTDQVMTINSPDEDDGHIHINSSGDITVDADIIQDVTQKDEETNNVLTALELRVSTFVGSGSIRDYAGAAIGPLSTDYGTDFIQWYVDTPYLATAAAYVTAFPELNFAADMSSFTPTQNALVIIAATPYWNVGNEGSVLAIISSSFSFYLGLNRQYEGAVTGGFVVSAGQTYVIKYRNYPGSNPHLWAINRISTLQL